MKSLTVDVLREVITLTDGAVSKDFHHQWVELYLSLALREDSRGIPAFLEATDLRQLRGWSLKKPESIGKEIARHLQNLVRLGLTDFIESPERTKRWRSSLSRAEILLLPSRKQCEAWLRQQVWDPLGGIDNLPRTDLCWITYTTRSLIRLQEGRIPEGLDLIGVAKRESGSLLLGGISELVEIRLLARRGEYPDPDDWQYLSQCEGQLGKVLCIRASLAQALAPDFEHLDKAEEALTKLTFRLQSLPDIEGLGTAYNALGVLFRRSGKLDLAQQCLRYAIALLIASYNLPTLQAALFNLGHVLYTEATKAEELEESLRLIELDREICQSLGLGKDSAQAEVVAGAICLSLGDVASAEGWLRRGQEIVHILESAYNRAEIMRLEARILWVRGVKEISETADREKILAKYREALDLLLQAGFPSNEVEDEMSLVRRGAMPAWIR